MNEIVPFRKIAWVIFLSLLFGWIAGTAPVEAQESSVLLDVTPAFEGNFKYGEWLPLWVSLENKGSDVAGTISVKVQSSGLDSTYAVNVSLPANSRKRVPLYVLPNNFSKELQITLISDGQTLVADKVPIVPRLNNNYLVGVVAESRGALSLMESVKPSTRDVRLVETTLEMLPDRVEGLRSFDLLVINQVDTSRMTPDQGAAIERWVRDGGRLVIGGGTDARLTTAGFPDALLPIKPENEIVLQSIDGLSEFAENQPILIPGPFYLATGKSAAESITLSDHEGVPIVQELVLGAGYIDFVALDLSGSPFDAWAGAISFWGELVRPGSLYPNWLPPDMSYRQQRSNQMYYALTILPMLDLPSARGLAILLAVYIVLIGPLNYLILRRLNRLHMAWITIPLLTGIFSVSAFGVGYMRRGTDIVLNKISMIELGSSGKADVTSYVGVFSPGQEQFSLEVEGGGLLSPLSNYYDPWSSVPGGVMLNQMKFVQGEVSQITGDAYGQGSLQSFMVETEWQNTGEIQADLSVQDKSLVGTVRNLTELSLKDTVLIIGSNFVRLGDLLPGDQVEVEMEFAVQGKGEFYSPPLSYRLFEADLSSMVGRPNRQAELKRAVIEANVEQGGGMRREMVTSGPGQSGLNLRGLLLGWVDTAPPEVTVGGEKAAEQVTGLLYTFLPLSFETNGEISVPPGLVPGTLTTIEGDAGSCGDVWSEAYYIGSGKVTIEYQFPRFVDSENISNLWMVLKSDNEFVGIPSVQVYNWNDDAWQTINNLSFGENIINNPGALINDRGMVRFQMFRENMMGGNCSSLSLGVKGS